MLAPHVSKQSPASAGRSSDHLGLQFPSPARQKSLSLEEEPLAGGVSLQRSPSLPKFKKATVYYKEFGDKSCGEMDLFGREYTLPTHDSHLALKSCEERCDPPSPGLKLGKWTFRDNKSSNMKGCEFLLHAGNGNDKSNNGEYPKRGVHFCYSCGHDDT